MTGNTTTADDPQTAHLHLITLKVLCLLLAQRFAGRHKSSPFDELLELAASKNLQVLAELPDLIIGAFMRPGNLGQGSSILHLSAWLAGGPLKLKPVPMYGRSDSMAGILVRCGRCMHQEIDSPSRSLPLGLGALRFRFSTT